VPWIQIHSRTRSRSVRLWGVRIRSRTRNNPSVSGPGPTPSPSGNKSHTLYTRTEHSFRICMYIHNTDRHVHTLYMCTLYTSCARAHIHNRTHICKYIYTHACISTPTCTSTHTHTNSLTPILTYLWKCMWYKHDVLWYIKLFQIQFAVPTYLPLSPLQAI
jgi:hypothetical protein